MIIITLCLDCVLLLQEFRLFFFGENLFLSSQQNSLSSSRFLLFPLASKFLD